MAGMKDIVIIAVDASPQADDAFSWYIDHLHKPENMLVLVHGLELPPMPTRDSWEKQQGEGDKKRLQLQETYTKKFNELNASGKFISEFEKPGELICDIAKRENASYIVMGTRGLGKIRRTIMGSVSDYVVHHATCPVIVFKN